MESQADSVSAALNRLTDSVFIDALSSRDSTAMTQLIEDFFCYNEDDKYSGIHNIHKFHINWKILSVLDLEDEDMESQSQGQHTRQLSMSLAYQITGTLYSTRDISIRWDWNRFRGSQTWR